jgi:nicotinamidase-related amidase
MTDTALLVLDLQRDFLAAKGRMPVGKGNAERVIASANRLLQHAESADWKIIVIKNEFHRSDWLGNLFRKGAAVEGSVGAENDPRVHFPANVTTLAKIRPDGFTNPALAEILQGSGIRRLVILGVMAEGCVRATVKSAISRGYAATVVADGVASTKDFLHRFGLRSMRKSGASLKSCDEILMRPDSLS